MVIANLFLILQTVKNMVRTLSKRRGFRARFDSQHVKASQILVKYPWERFYHVFSSFSEKLIWKVSPLVLLEILVFKMVRICNSNFKYNYLKDEKLFVIFFFFFFFFWNLHQILNRLNKMTIVLANVFPKLQTVKNLVRLLSKKRRFTTRFDSQHVKGSQMLAKSPWQHIYHFFSIILWEVDFENVSLSDRWNLTGFS